MNSTIPFKEDFKPSTNYKPYLLISTAASLTIVSAIALGWLVVTFAIALLGSVALAAGLLIFILLAIVAVVYLWVQRYYKSIIYHLNDTEMTWKRGVFFRRTGIVPYNRITDINITQGPLMRLFKISNLQIQTAGSAVNKSGSDISIIGVEDAEPLRAFIMDFVRGTPQVSAATGGIESPASSGSAIKSTEMERLISEVSEIRKLLEEQKK
ncbi:MAG: PH domain-containing protein [Methanosarcinales archaeon]|jgi:membrane protein YdbS with pleckstrin-like domain|nr:PH domain-containing protein [Methanosarcinales archaeon]